VQNSKFTVTELCLALTIFREELNFRTLGLFTALLFVKVFHWLATMRVENVRLCSFSPFLVVPDSAACGGGGGDCRWLGRKG
jgi:hypothetical protein